jgi:arylformamidase
MARIVDLTHPLVPGASGRKFEAEMIGADQVNPNVVRLENQWYIMHNVRMVNHLGTHIEVPYHLMKDGADLASFPLERLCGEAVVLDLRGLPAEAAIEVGDVEKAAVAAGGIRSGDIAFCNLGYARHYGTPEYDRKPWFSEGAIEWLAGTGIKMLGVDASGVEVPGSEEHVNHMALFSRNIALIENLAGLDQLGRARVMVYAFPIAAQKIDSFPLRVVAFEG